MEALAFAALADERRLAIIDALGTGELSVGELTGRFDISQPAISQHLKVLRDAGLVSMRPAGQRRLYSVAQDGFRVVELWLQRHRRVWARRLDALESFMNQEEQSDA